MAVLREAVAERHASRRLSASPEQTLITNGVQQAIDLTVRALAEPLDPVLIESPTYPGAPDALTGNHSRVIAVGINDSVTALGTSIRQVLPRLAYLITDFQNPTGRLLDSASRAFVVEAAESSRSRLVVDGTFVELGPDNSDLPPPLASCERGDTVISVGSVSNAFWGIAHWLSACGPHHRGISCTGPGNTGHGESDPRPASQMPSTLNTMRTHLCSSSRRFPVPWLAGP